MAEFSSRSRILILSAGLLSAAGPSYCQDASLAMAAAAGAGMGGAMGGFMAGVEQALASMDTSGLYGPRRDSPGSPGSINGLDDARPAAAGPQQGPIPAAFAGAPLGPSALTQNPVTQAAAASAISMSPSLLESALKAPASRKDLSGVAKKLEGGYFESGATPDSDQAAPDASGQQRFDGASKTLPSQEPRNPSASSRVHVAP